MFWAKRLKQDAQAEGAWMLPYGDLMTLLLAVFVMIAAMSELRAGERFGRIRGGVLKAFGFSQADSPSPGGVQRRRPATLLERLEQAGFQQKVSTHLVGPDDAVLAPCDVLVDGQTLTIRIAGHVLFGRHSAVVEPSGVQALRRLAEFLSGGSSRLEVCGHGDSGPLPSAVPFRDGMDLSYARARAATEILVQHGVARNRLFITAWSDYVPLSAESPAGEKPAAMPEGLERRIEIVVHPVSAAAHDRVIAEKDRTSDG